MLLIEILKIYIMYLQIYAFEHYQINKYFQVDLKKLGITNFSPIPNRSDIRS